MSEPATNIDFSSTKNYQDKLLTLLGESDPLSILESTPTELEKMISKYQALELRKRPFEGKWTPNEILGHLCDAEYLYAYRIKMILCEDHPDIHPMDQELWVTGQRYNDMDPTVLLNMFKHLRNFNLILWRGMGPKEFARTGRHVQRGEESLGLMIRMNAGHDLSHLDQLKRYLEALN